MIILILCLSAALGFCGGVRLAQATRFPGEDQPGWELFLGCLGGILVAQLVSNGWVELQLWGLL